MSNKPLDFVACRLFDILRQRKLTISMLSECAILRDAKTFKVFIGIECYGKMEKGCLIISYA